MFKYNDDNVFARILRKELPATIIYETEYTLAFKDINPIVPIHFLVIPKGKYTSFEDFQINADIIVKTDFWDSIIQVTEKLGIHNSGYRLVSNIGIDAGQEVPHFHFHILAGKKLASKC